MDFLDEIAASADERPERPARPEPQRPKRDGFFYGRAIYDGRLQFLSVSSLSLGDPESTGGCPRRWFFEKVLGKKLADDGYANVLGTALHDENARYLVTGDRSGMGPLALAGLHMLQPPGPDLHVEHEMASGKPGHLVSALTCAGLPVVGKIDLWHRRGTCAGATDVMDTHDPAGTTEVQDHKTTSDLKWALDAARLPDTVQMSGYGVWAVRDHGADPVRLSHGYYVTKGRPRAEKHTILVPAERLLRRWEYVEGVGRVLSDLTQETDPDRVPFNVKSCDFPRRKKVDIDAGIPDGCPHRSYCSGARQHALTMLYGEKENDDMGLLDELLENDAPKAEPAPPPADDGLRALLGFVRGAAKTRELGFPALGGELAVAASELSGATMEGSGLAGTGRLGKMVISDRAVLQKLAVELGWSPDKHTQPAAERPPPQLETPEAEQAKAHAAAKVAQEAADKAAAEKLAADAKAVKAAAKKAAKHAPVTDTTAPATQPVATPELPPDTDADGDYHVRVRRQGARLVLIDCRPDFPATDLRPLVHAWADRLADKCGVKDVRSNAVDRDSPLAYGGWRGALTAVCRAELAALQPGIYYLDTRDGDFAQIAADAAGVAAGVSTARGLR